MKVKVKTQKQKFQPIELVITIENEQDLINLWHRFLLNAEEVNEGVKHYSDRFNGKMCTGDHFDIFNKLDDLATERNLKSK